MSEAIYIPVSRVLEVMGLGREGENEMHHHWRPLGWGCPRDFILVGGQLQYRISRLPEIVAEMRLQVAGDRGRREANAERVQRLADLLQAWCDAKGYTDELALREEGRQIAARSRARKQSAGSAGAVAGDSVHGLKTEPGGRITGAPAHLSAEEKKLWYQKEGFE